MEQKQNKNELLAQSMSRKDFLRFIGLGVFAAFGVNNFIQYLNSNTPQPKSQQTTRQSSGRGFGSSSFGA